MIFPPVTRRRGVPVDPSSPPKSREDEARIASERAAIEQRQSVILARSFAAVRTEFSDLDGQTTPKVRNPSCLSSLHFPTQVGAT
jgi:hypothetical protein